MKPSDILKRRDGLDPLPEVAELSATSPLVKEDNDVWVAIGRAEVRAVLGDSEKFVTEPKGDDLKTARSHSEPGNPLQWDGPEHARLRRMLAPEFTPRRVRAITPLLEEFVAEQLDVLERAGQPVDLMRYFAWPIAGRVCSLLFGVPREDMAEMARHAAIRTLRNGRKQSESAKAYGHYVHRLVASKRRDPGEDMLSRLIREHGDDITDDELVGLFSAVVFSELEAMSHMTGVGVLALLSHPDQLALLRERPELMNHAVEELVRYVSIVPFISPRTAATDVRVGDQMVKAGEVVHCSVFSANRAKPPGEPPDILDITRDNTNHLAFGHGTHYCIGAALARVQLGVCFAGLLRHFPELRLAVPPDEVRYRVMSPQYGVETLPVAW